MQYLTLGRGDNAIITSWHLPSLGLPSETIHHDFDAGVPALVAGTCGADDLRNAGSGPKMPSPPHKHLNVLYLAAVEAPEVEDAVGGLKLEGDSNRDGRDDPSRFCPACSARLEPRKCKLLCQVCGYYMSCSDYY